MHAAMAWRRTPTPDAGRRSSVRQGALHARVQVAAPRSSTTCPSTRCAAYSWQRLRASSKQTAGAVTTARLRPERQYHARGWNGDKGELLSGAGVTALVAVSARFERGRKCFSLLGGRRFVSYQTAEHLTGVFERDPEEELDDLWDGELFE